MTIFCEKHKDYKRLVGILIGSVGILIFSVGILILSVGILILSVGILIFVVGIMKLLRNCRDYDCRDFDCRDSDIDPLNPILPVNSDLRSGRHEFHLSNALKSEALGVLKF